jgi:hypothetical protein
MAVPMMCIGRMRVRMRNREVHVFMGMRFAYRVSWSVRVMMIVVMQMLVSTLNELVATPMRVPFGKVKPHAQRRPHISGDDAQYPAKLARSFVYNLAGAHIAAGVLYPACGGLCLRHSRAPLWPSHPLA